MVSEFVKWSLVIIASFFGIVILYFVSWHIFATLAPSIYEKLALSKVHRNIRRYFSFLFEKGYRIQDAHFYYQHFGGWSVQLESENSLSLIRIIQDRSEISVSFIPRKWEMNMGIGLMPMIYYVSGGKRFIGYYDGDIHRDEKGQYKWLASLLKEYLDQIMLCFGDQFGLIKNDLISSQNTYNYTMMHHHVIGERH